jgi:transposase
MMGDVTVDIWALDEVHFQQQGSRCRMWVPPETKDPLVYHHPTRKSVGYFAAVRLRDGEFLFRRETGRFNGESFWEFLKVLQEASVVPGRRVLAISDNAQYHRSRLHQEWRDQQAPQFGLDFLPPYSPELNPIERVWKLTRRLCLHNRYFGFLDGVVSAVEGQFAEWTKPNDALRRLCAIT